MRFRRFIGIDYSGAATPGTRLSGLRVFSAERSGSPTEIRPEPDSRRHWTRRQLAEWLLSEFQKPDPVIVGIDHSFSFPHRYFERYGLSPDWSNFLRDFCRHWPTDHEGLTVRHLRTGNPRTGDAKDRRLAEIMARAKSSFHFDVPGSVASSTHAGLPWLLWLRQRSIRPVHVWPFDGLEIPESAHGVAEVYPALWYRDGAPPDWTRDQWDAFLIAEALRDASRSGALQSWLNPAWTAEQFHRVLHEGWILGLDPIR